MLAVVVELDAKVLCELFEVPGVVFARVGSRVVGRGHIGDSLLVDTDYLEKQWVRRTEDCVERLVDLPSAGPARLDWV